MDQKPEEPGKPKEGKKHFLTVEERTNVQARRSLAQQYDYLSKLVGMDIANYMYSTVYTRISIDPSRPYKLSEDNTFITLSEEVKD